MSLYSAHQQLPHSGISTSCNSGANVFFGRVAGALPDALGMAAAAGNEGGRLADARACCIGLEALSCCQCFQCGAAAAALYFVDELYYNGGALLALLFATKQKPTTNRNGNDFNGSFDFAPLGQSEAGDDDTRPEDLAVPDTYDRWAFRGPDRRPPHVSGGPSTESWGVDPGYGTWDHVKSVP